MIITTFFFLTLDFKSTWLHPLSSHMNSTLSCHQKTSTILCSVPSLEYSTVLQGPFTACASPMVKMVRIKFLHAVGYRLNITHISHVYLPALVLLELVSFANRILVHRCNLNILSVTFRTILTFLHPFLMFSSPFLSKLFFPQRIQQNSYMAS